MEQLEDDGYIEEDPLESLLDLVMAIDDYTKASDMMRAGIAADMAEDALFTKCLQVANVIHEAMGAETYYADLFRDFERDVENMRAEALEPELDPLFLTYFLEVTVPGIAMLCMNGLDPRSDANDCPFYTVR